MISMSRINDIRRLGREGKNVSEIARTVGVCRDTVYKYLKADDLSPKIPVRKGRKSKLDPYRPPSRAGSTRTASAGASSDTPRAAYGGG